jgi:hypothetical protein
MGQDFGNVLFVHNGYYQGRKEFGPTSNWEITWGLSVKSFFGDHISIFNPDVFGPYSDIESDFELLRLIEEIHPKFLIMIYHNGHLWSRNFIALETLAKIKKKGISIISIWGDIHIPEQRALLRQLAPYTSLSLCSETEAVVARLGMPDKVQYIWVPILELQSISNKDCACGYMVSFAGSQKDKRAKTIRYLKRKRIQIHIGGGEGVGTLSRSEYLNLVGHPMTISFAGTIFESFTNARTFEAISQKSLLLEQWGTETCKLLKPYVEYVPWFSKRDLRRKIQYYQNHPDELLKIAERGHLRFGELSNNNLWKMSLSRISGENIDSQLTTFRMNLNGIPFIYRYVSIFLDAISRNPRFEPIFDFRLKVRDKMKLKIRNWYSAIKSKIRLFRIFGLHK